MRLSNWRLTRRGEAADPLIEPVGKWLIWYATQVGLQYCSGEANDTLIALESLELALLGYCDFWLGEVETLCSFRHQENLNFIAGEVGASDDLQKL